MNRGPLRLRRPGAARAHGFSMIEVLIALVVLALGLLGFALLQTMNLRYTQSANTRTQATNLAYDLLDQMRANRFAAAYYAGSTGAGFTSADGVSGTDCSRPVNAVSIPLSIGRWQCQVVAALGEDAGAEVTYEDGEVMIGLTWGERVSVDPSTLVVETRL